MMHPNFDRLRPGLPGCPSDLALDRFAAEELPTEAAEGIRAHLKTCAVCPERLKASRFEAMPEVDERAMLAGIRRRLDAKRSLRERALAWLRRAAAGRVAVAVAVGVAAMLLVLPLSRRQSRVGPAAPDTIRQKGAPVLRVYRLKGQGSEEVLSGARFATGDVIRFVVDLPSAGRLTILGVEPSGNLYTAWPLDQQDTRRPAGKAQVLPGAMALDRSVGRETIYLAHCPVAAGAPACRSRGASEPPACPPGCVLSPFVLDKAQ